jgi:hypothetical protein
VDFENSQYIDQNNYGFRVNTYYHIDPILFDETVGKIKIVNIVDRVYFLGTHRRSHSRKNENRFQVDCCRKREKKKASPNHCQLTSILHMES